MSDLNNNLKKLKNLEPTAAWKSKQWESLQSQIKSDDVHVFNNWEKIGFIFQHPAILRPVGNFMAVAVVFVVGSWAALATVQNSLPGNLVYPAKMALERFDIALSINDQTKATKQTDQANKRVDELQSLVKRTAVPIQAVHVDRTVKNIHKSLQEAQQNLAKLNLAKGNGDLLETVTQIEKSVHEISSDLQETREQLPTDVRLSVNKEIDDTVETADNLSAQTFEMVIKQWLADDSISENIIVMKFKEKLTELDKDWQVLAVATWLEKQPEENELLIVKVTELNNTIEQDFEQVESLYASKDYVSIMLLVDKLRKEIKEIEQYQNGTLVLGVEEEEETIQEENSTSTTDTTNETEVEGEVETENK